MNDIPNILGGIDPAIYFSQVFNIEVIPARITLVLLGNIPLSFLQPTLIQRLPIATQHLLNGLFGLIAMFYCFGAQTWHIVTDVVIFITLVRTIGGTLSSVLIAWLTIFPHLLYGYYQILMAETKTRTIYWTVPHCVLTLKLIGLAYDLFDVKQQSRAESEDTDGTQLETGQVTLLEVFGFAFFYPTSLVGPQVLFRRYKDFVEGKLYDRNTIKCDFVYGLQRFTAGVLAGLFYSTLGSYVPIEYFVTPEFASQSMFYKLGFTILRHFISLKQYYTVWLFSEASCIITGVSFKHKEANGSVDWSACAGVNLIKLETAYTGKSLIDSFNVTTNQWALKYVYKKCKFLRNKILSQFITLCFISTWHGFYMGYYLCMFSQIPTVYVELLATSLILKKPLSEQRLPLRVLLFTLGVAYRYYIVSIPFTFFQLLTWERCWTFSKAINHCYFIGYLILIPTFAMLAFIKKKNKKIKD